MQFAFKLSIHGQSVDASFDELISLAKHAEDAGFKGVYVIDHLLLPGSRLRGYTNADPERPYFLDAWTSLAAIAASTQDMLVGPQVTPIGLRHPAFVAKWGATVDRVSGGRLLLQVGAGHQKIEYDAYDLPYPSLSERVERLREGIEIIRALWTDQEPVSYNGDHYTLRDVEFWPKPSRQGRHPIWLGGTSKYIRELVVEVGDGWTPAAPQRGGLDTTFYRDSLEEMRDRSGRPITGGALFYSVVDDEPSQVNERVRVLQRREDWSSMSVDELRDSGIVLAGSPDQVSEAIVRYKDAGVEHMTIAFVPLDDLKGTHEMIETYGKSIIPRFNE